MHIQDRSSNVLLIYSVFPKAIDIIFIKNTIYKQRNVFAATPYVINQRSPGGSLNRLVHSSHPTRPQANSRRRKATWDVLGHVIIQRLHMYGLCMEYGVFNSALAIWHGPSCAVALHRCGLSLLTPCTFCIVNRRG